MHKPLRLIAALFTLFFIFGCTESEQQKWTKKSDWNFMINTCSAGQIELPDCSLQSAQQAASTWKANIYMIGYEFRGPNELLVKFLVSPNHPYYNQLNIEKMTRLHTAPITYIKGKKPNTLSIILHNNGCEVTTNYRLVEPGKVYEQTVSAVGSSCSENQRFISTEEPKLVFITRN